MAEEYVLAKAHLFKKRNETKTVDVLADAEKSNLDTAKPLEEQPQVLK